MKGPGRDDASPPRLCGRWPRRLLGKRLKTFVFCSIMTIIAPQVNCSRGFVNSVFLPLKRNVSLCCCYTGNHRLYINMDKITAAQKWRQIIWRHDWQLRLTCEWTRTLFFGGTWKILYTPYAGNKQFMIAQYWNTIFSLYNCTSNKTDIKLIFLLQSFEYVNLETLSETVWNLPLDLSLMTNLLILWIIYGLEQILSVKLFITSNLFSFFFCRA